MTFQMNFLQKYINNDYNFHAVNIESNFSNGK